MYCSGKVVLLHKGLRILGGNTLARVLHQLISNVYFLPLYHILLQVTSREDICSRSRLVCRTRSWFLLLVWVFSHSLHFSGFQNLFEGNKETKVLAVSAYSKVTL